MASIYIDQMCVDFLELLLLKYGENAVFFFKITQNELKSPLF